jgi:hypothetical protein
VSPGFGHSAHVRTERGGGAFHGVFGRCRSQKRDQTTRLNGVPDARRDAFSQQPSLELPRRMAHTSSVGSQTVRCLQCTSSKIFIGGHPTHTL